MIDKILTELKGQTEKPENSKLTPFCHETDEVFLMQVAAACVIRIAELSAPSDPNQQSIKFNQA